MKTHDDITGRLSEYIDGDLGPREHAEVDAHLTGCAACREVLGQLRTIAGAARRLPTTAPDRDLWDGVAERIGAPSSGNVTPLARRTARRFSFTIPQMAAAAIVLMALSGSLAYVLRPGGEAPASAPGYGITTAGATRDITPVALVDPQYDDAIADLEAVLDAGRTKLDPETIRVLEQNLATIDQAIAQCRRALEADPANAFLNSHLVSARQRKLALLRRATALTAGS